MKRPSRRRSARPDPGPRAFTLVEMLAVITLVTLVVGVAGVGLASSRASARLHSAAGRWRALDARARLFARTDGPVVMTLETGRRTVRLHLEATGELLAATTLPADGSMTIGSEETRRGVAFDRGGRSADYEFELRATDRARRWRVAGLTGLVREVVP